MSPFPTLHMVPSLRPAQPALRFGTGPECGLTVPWLGPAWQGPGAPVDEVGKHIYHSIDSDYARRGSFLIPLCGGGGPHWQGVPEARAGAVAVLWWPWAGVCAQGPHTGPEATQAALRTSSQ